MKSSTDVSVFLRDLDDAFMDKISAALFPEDQGQLFTKQGAVNEQTGEVE
jgi:hypothetical protein